MKSKALYTFMDVDATIQRIKSVCESAKAGGYTTVVLPQWFVQYASELLGDSAAVGTVVGLPGGMTSTYAKYAEAKQAVQNGARVLIIPMNMEYLAQSDFARAQNDLTEAMAPCKEKAKVYALIESGRLSPASLQKAAGACANSGVDCVLLSRVCGGHVAKEELNAMASVKRIGIYGAMPPTVGEEDIHCFTVTAKA